MYSVDSIEYEVLPYAVSVTQSDSPQLYYLYFHRMGIHPYMTLLVGAA